MVKVSHRRQHGFGLLEILISVLVLSIGLLGLAGLHVAGMRSTHSAYYRAQATILTYDIVDRMRVNAEAARAGEYDVASIAAYGSDQGGGNNEAAAADDNAGNDGGGTASRAEADLDTWRTALDVLPSYDGSIDCGSNGDCLVTVVWDDSRPEKPLNDYTGNVSNAAEQASDGDGGNGNGNGNNGGGGSSSPSERSTVAASLTFSLRTRI